MLKTQAGEQFTQLVQTKIYLLKRNSDTLKPQTGLFYESEQHKEVVRY